VAGPRRTPAAQEREAPSGTRLRTWLRRSRQAAVFRRRTITAWLTWPLLYPLAWLWRRTVLRHKQVWAVTGSMGKTSSAAAAAAALGVGFNVDRPNYGPFLARDLLASSPRQPYVVFEVGISRPGQMRAYARLLRPDLVVLTAIDREHLAAFGDQDSLAGEKALLPRAVHRTGLVIINGDDSRCRAIANELTAPVVRVGSAADCEWRVGSSELDFPHGTRFRLVAPDGAEIELHTRLIGAEMARCVAFGAVAALASGVPISAVTTRLAAMPPHHGRLEPIALPGGAWLLHDAWKGHQPTAESALCVLGQLKGWRRIAVLGEVEEPRVPQGPSYRAYGRQAAGVAERIVFVGSRTGYERARGGILAVRDAPSLQRCADVHAAAQALVGEDAPGTVILLKARHSQKLARLVHLLQGENVDCRLRTCPARGLRCELCPRLR
jgi:UDP-N-acetylmuramyl pentapeptide synthase